MKWSSEADEAVKKVPFFIRKKVRKKVEAFAEQKSKFCVELDDVEELKKKFLAKGGMEKQIKGYEVSVCFGGSGCPNVANSTVELAAEIETYLKKQDLLEFLKQTVQGDLKFHHEFRVVLSDCPNACSRPQIADIGIIGATLPGISDEPCQVCNACVDVCDEEAIVLDMDKVTATINYDNCLACKKCIDVCPSGTLVKQQAGFRVLLGGRLGRHPRLGMEVPGIINYEQTLDIVKKSIKFYKVNSDNGKRFAHLLSSIDQILKDE